MFYQRHKRSHLAVRVEPPTLVSQINLCTETEDQQLSSTSSKFQMSESETEWEMQRPALKCQQSQLLNNMPDTAAAAAAAAICMTTRLHFVFVWLCASTPCERMS